MYFDTRYETAQILLEDVPLLQISQSQIFTSAYSLSRIIPIEFQDISTMLNEHFGFNYVESRN